MITTPSVRATVSPDAPTARRGPGRPGPHAEQHDERDGSARQELEEAAAGVLGVGQAVGDEDAVAGPGQGHELGSHEGGVERAQAAQHHGRLDRAQRRPGREGRAGCLGAGRPDQAERDPGPEEHQDQVLEDEGHVEPGPEDRVSRGQQPADHEQDRPGEQRPAGQRARPLADGLARGRPPPGRNMPGARTRWPTTSTSRAARAGKVAAARPLSPLSEVPRTRSPATARATGTVTQGLDRRVSRSASSAPRR